MIEVAQTAKAFLLDNPQATSSELNEHLKSMALSFLTDKVESFWSGIEVDHLGDTAANLKTLALRAMTIDQQTHIAKSLEVLKAAAERVHHGDTQPLLSIIASMDGRADPLAHKSDASPAFLSEKQRDRLEFDDLSVMYIDEHKVNLKPATLRDIQSAHKSLTVFAKGINWKSHTRAEVAALRDAMRDSGKYADATVNKMLAKLCALINWACQNGHIDHDYTKGLKVKGVKSTRRAFSKDELEKVVTAIHEESEGHKRLFGLIAVITGARCGELTQLTKADIIKEADHICIDINDENDKTIKTASSARLIPLTDGAHGFSLKEFQGWVQALPSDDSLVFKVSRDTASHWFNKEILSKALPNRTGDLVLHSLRHTLATSMKQADISESTAQDVLGHRSQSITFGLYGKARSVDNIAKALGQALSKSTVEIDSGSELSVNRA